MAKKSKIAKYQKQQALIERYAEKRYAVKQAGRRGGTVNETRFSNGLSSNEEPKYQNKKESVKANPRSQTRKEKITGVTGLTLWVFFST